MSPAVALNERLRVALSAISWVSYHAAGTASVAEIAQALGVGERQLRRDLLLVSCCGSGQRYGGELIDVVLFEEADEVEVGPNEPLARPVRLSRSEAVRVLTAGRALAATGTQADALDSALAKLAAAVGDVQAVAVDAELGRLGADLRDAAAQRHRVEIDYYSLSSDEISTRTIDPLAVSHIDGAWYVDAVDHSRDGDERRFRVSRVLAVRHTDETFEPRPPTADQGRAFTDQHDPGHAEVTVRLPASARWAAEAYPVVSVTDLDDGGVEATFTVASRPFLERMLLRAGPGARVVAPPEWVGTAATAAERLLARYRRR